MFACLLHGYSQNLQVKPLLHKQHQNCELDISTLVTASGPENGYMHVNVVKKKPNNNNNKKQTENAIIPEFYQQTATPKICSRREIISSFAALVESNHYIKFLHWSGLFF